MSVSGGHIVFQHKPMPLENGDDDTHLQAPEEQPADGPPRPGKRQKAGTTTLEFLRLFRQDLMSPKLNSFLCTILIYCIITLIVLWTKVMTNVLLGATIGSYVLHISVNIWRVIASRTCDRSIFPKSPFSYRASETASLRWVKQTRSWKNGRRSTAWRLLVCQFFCSLVGKKWVLYHYRDFGEGWKMGWKWDVKLGRNESSLERLQDMKFRSITGEFFQEAPHLLMELK